MLSKNMKEDIKFATIVEEWISKHPDFLKKYKGVKRVKYDDDPTAQLKGVDLKYADENGIEHVGDVKGVASTTLPTFCLELSAYEDNLTWLNKVGILTDKLLLAYVKVKGASGNYTEDKKLVKSVDDIESMELIIVDENDLKKVLNEAFDKSVKKDLNEIRDDLIKAKNDGCYEDEGLIYFWYNEKGDIKKVPKDLIKKLNLPAWFTYSPWLKEKPINLVVKKQVYLNKVINEHMFLKPILA